MNKVYEDIYKESEAMEASPYRLVQMLMEGCVKQIHSAKNFMGKNDISLKCQAIGKAIDIIAYLRMSLNMEDPSAKKLSVKLDEVYSFIDYQLLQANLKNDVSYLESALEKLLIIKSAWDQIESKA